MPINKRKDVHGPFFQWGDTGAKYYYNKDNKESIEHAREKSAKQGRAVEVREAYVAARSKK